MEKDPQGQKQHDLKQEREAITPGEQNWNEDNDSNGSNISEQGEQNKEVTIQINPNSQKKEVQIKTQSPKNKKQFVTIQHSVDHNYLILLIILNSHNLVNPYLVSGLKEGRIHLVGKQSKILVQALSQQQGAQAIQKISDYIDKISLLKLNIRGEHAFAIARFNKLKSYLRKDSIIVFSAPTKLGRQLFMGGQVKPATLRANSQKITQIKLVSFFLRAYKNKRSYKTIVGQIMNTEYMQQAFRKFNLVQYTQIEKRNKAKQLKITIGCLSKKDISVYQYQIFMMNQISKFYVLTFCFESQEKYLQKLKCDKVIFKFTKEIKFNRSYLFVIALKQDFLLKHQEIKNEINKIGDKIIGVRLFYKIYPQFKSFYFDKDQYYLFRFPQQRPYSTVVTARRKEGNIFDWKIFYSQVVALQNKINPKPQ